MRVCEKCIYRSGEHREDCPVRQQEEALRRLKDEILAEPKDSVLQRVLRTK